MWFRGCLNFIWQIASIGTPRVTSVNPLLLFDVRVSDNETRNHISMSAPVVMYQSTVVIYQKEIEACYLPQSQTYKTLTVLKAMSYVQCSCLKFEEQPKILWVKAKLQEAKRRTGWDRLSISRRNERPLWVTSRGKEGAIQEGGTFFLWMVERNSTLMMTFSK